jgi:hypothetical protein
LSPIDGFPLVGAAEIEERLNEIATLFARDPLIVDIDSAHQEIRERRYPRAA